MVQKSNFLLHPLLLSILFGVFMWLAWPPLPFAFLLFVGFLPILFIEEKLSQSQSRWYKAKLLGYVYLAFLIWNVLTTWLSLIHI